MDAFVIMPNHIHGIIQLVEGNATDIGEIVRNFKSISARRVRTVTRRDSPVWQRNYFERIIRTDRELNLTRMYVKLNPRMWMSHLKLVGIDFKSEEDLAKLLEPYSHL